MECCCAKCEQYARLESSTSGAKVTLEIMQFHDFSSSNNCVLSVHSYPRVLRQNIELGDISKKLSWILHCCGEPANAPHRSSLPGPGCDSNLVRIGTLRGMCCRCC